ncbi:MAG: Ycf66 family protein [Synechococcales bacterium]|nr:Ycf66 family protein [Synechococcales bacterium]
MLTYLLALAVGLGSLGLYVASFVLPEINRKNDLIWSGVGLFYALVLWVCAGRITGGVLLGQMAGVALIGWLGWQVLQTRWEALPLEQRQNNQTLQQVQSFLQSGTVTKVKEQAQQAFNQVQAKVKDVAATQSAGQSSPTQSNGSGDDRPLTREDFGNPPINNAAVADASSSAEPTIAAATPSETTNPLSSLVGSAKSFLAGLKSPKNSETYVRKDFRESAEEDSAFDFGNLTDKVAETMKKRVGKVQDTIETVAEQVVEKVTETAETVVDQVEQTADQVADKAENLVEKVTETQPSKAVQQVVNQVVEQVSEPVAKLTETASETLAEILPEPEPKTLTETAEAIVQEVAETVTDKASDVKEAIAEGADQVEELIEEQEVPPQLKRPDSPKA